MHSPLYDRRSALKLGASGLMALTLPYAPTAFADKSDFSIEKAHRDGVIRFPRMVQDYYLDRVKAIEEKAVARRMALSTKEEAEAYIEEVRGKIQQSFGPWPERTPLNPRITSTIERDTYRVENIIFESRPGFLVTANLYIPTERKGPFPGVVGTCGHTRNGKAGYQEFSQGLVKQGYMVLIYDPIGQGERFQYVDDQLEPTIGPGTSEHIHAGNQQFLVGEHIGAWRAWDGIRALDYLLTRDELDPKHLGITGNSGGGTMTTWLSGVEERWTMLAPSCFVSTIRRNFENEEAQDTEQCPPLVLALGLDHVDFLLASAPDPIIVLSKEKDFFDIRGSEETFEQLKHVYTVLGIPEKVDMFAGPTTHGYTQENREAMYGWFNVVTGAAEGSAEPEIVKEEDATLFCAPKGQVATLNSKTIFEFTKEKAETLAKARKPITDLGTLQNTIHDVLRIPKDLPTTPPEFRVMKTIRGNNYPKKRHSRYAVETEAGIHALVYRLSDTDQPSRPTQTDAPAILYIPHISSDYELVKEPLIREVMEAAPDAVVYTCDVRGIGESRPDVARNNSFLSRYGGDYMHAVHGIMLDEPYLGRKVIDILRTLDFLKAYGHQDVHIIGRGWGALSATFAAVLSPTITQVTLKAAPESYTDIASTEHYAWPLHTLPYRILEHMDLTDCYAVLEAKKLKRI